MKIIRKTEHLEMPWSNSKGITSEMAIYPKKATLKAMNFDWRLSSAKIDADNQFSKFSGFHRYLAIIDGDPVLLNKEKLELFQVLKFSGDQPIYCQRTTNKSVVDVGLIFNPIRCQPNFEVFSESAMAHKSEVIICVAGVIEVDQHKIYPLDFAIIDQSTRIQCSDPEGKFIRISGLAH